MNELQTEAIDRGLLLTLDDALFTTNAFGLSIAGHRRRVEVIIEDPSTSAPQLDVTAPGT